MLVAFVGVVSSEVAAATGMSDTVQVVIWLVGLNPSGSVFLG